MSNILSTFIPYFYRRASIFASSRVGGGITSASGAPVQPIQRSMSFKVEREHDPRPVSSTSFKNAAMQEVEQFMIENEYSHPISAQKLTSPTARDFQTMVTFLLRQLDSSFHVSGRVEDDVTLAAKALHYPFIPSKTAITAVGAPTTWPALLAMLLWFVELLQYNKELKIRDADGTAGLMGDASAAGTSDYFWWYIRQAYTLFLAGEDERIERLEAECSTAFSAQVTARTAELKQEEAELAALEEQLHEIQGTQSVLPMLRTEVTNLGHDIAACTKAELEMREFEAALHAKAAEVQAEQAALTAQLERSRAEVERIANIVASQELTLEDVKRMASTKSALKSRRDALAATRTTSSGETDTLRLDLRKHLDILQNKVKDYHDTGRQLQIIPVGAKWSGGQDWSLRIDERALIDKVAANPSFGYGGDDKRQAAYALLGCTDFKNGQKEWLRRLRQGLTTNAEKAKGNIRKELDMIADATEKRSDKVRLAEDASSSAAQIEAAVRRETESGELRLRDQGEELARAELARDEKRAQLDAALAAARELGPSVLGELSAAIRHMAAQQTREKESIKDTASRMALKVVEHVQHVKSLMEHASASSITAKNRQAVIEAERDSRIRQLLLSSSSSSSSSMASSSLPMPVMQTDLSSSMLLFGNNTSLGSPFSLRKESGAASSSLPMPTMRSPSSSMMMTGSSRSLPMPTSFSSMNTSAVSSSIPLPPPQAPMSSFASHSLPMPSLSTPSSSFSSNSAAKPPTGGFTSPAANTRSRTTSTMSATK